MSGSDSLRNTDVGIHQLRGVTNKLVAFYARSAYDGLITDEDAVNQITDIWRDSRVTSLGTVDEIFGLLEVYDERYRGLVAHEDGT